MTPSLSLSLSLFRRRRKKRRNKRRNKRKTKTVPETVSPNRHYFVMNYDEYGPFICNQYVNTERFLEFDKLEEVVARYDVLTERLADPTIYDRQDEYKKVTAERSGIEELVEVYKHFKKVKDDFISLFRVLDFGMKL